MARTPVVNGEECISCGVCVDICPEVFRLNDRDVSEVYNPSGAPIGKNPGSHRKLPGAVHPLGMSR